MVPFLSLASEVSLALEAPGPREMSGATKEIGAPEYRIGKFRWNFCPDAPGDNDLRPGTWTRRHRSKVVSVRNLAKSNSKHAERVGEDHAGPDTARSCKARRTVEEPL